MNPYYDAANLTRVPDLIRLSPKPANAYLAFEKETYHGADALPLKTKELIAVAVAHVTGCPYCIDTHVKKYRELGGTMEEILEAAFVAASTRAGAILSHATHALISFESSVAEPPVAAPGHDKDRTTSSSGPECFC